MRRSRQRQETEVEKMFTGKDIGIDLGTATVVLCTRGRGVIAMEPSVAALDRTTGKVLKVGVQAERMLGRTPGNIAALHPLQGGVIADFEMTAYMIRELIHRVVSVSLVKPRLLMSVPSGISEVEERALIDAAISAGARKVYLMEASISAAIGAGMDISKAEGNLIVNVGAGVTDVAVLSIGGVVQRASVKIAGDAFDEAIIKYIRKKHNLVIGRTTAEELKRSIGCVFPRPDEDIFEARGRSLMTGLPMAVTITSSETIEAFDEVSGQIIEAIHSVLEDTPPELVADIAENGIVLTGGGSLLWGFDRLVESSTSIKTRLADDAQMCVAHGIVKNLSHIGEMQDGPINLARQWLLKEH